MMSNQPQDITSYLRSAFIDEIIIHHHHHHRLSSTFYATLRKTAENAASDGFWSNFSAAAFCAPNQLVGVLLRLIFVILAVI